MRMAASGSDEEVEQPEVLPRGIEEVQRWRRRGILCMAFGFLLQTVVPFVFILLVLLVDVGSSLLSDKFYVWVYVVIATGFCGGGVAYYAKSKSQSPFHGLWGLIPILGPFLGLGALALEERLMKL